MTMKDELCSALRAHRKDLVGHKRDLVAHGESEYARAMEDTATWCDAFAEMNELNPTGVAYLFVADALRDGTVKLATDEAQPERCAEAALAKVRQERHDHEDALQLAEDQEGWRVPLACLVGLEPTGSWDSIYEETRMAFEAKMPDHVEQCLRERAQICDTYCWPGDHNIADHVDRVVHEFEQRQEQLELDLELSDERLKELLDDDPRRDI